MYVGPPHQESTNGDDSRLNADSLAICLYGSEAEARHASRLSSIVWSISESKIIDSLLQGAQVNLSKKFERFHNP